MRFIQVREFLRGSPESILKEIKDRGTQQGGVRASGEEGGCDREQVRGRHHHHQASWRTVRS